MRKIKVLLVAGSLNSNYSYEYINFLKPLERICDSVTTFDFIKIMEKHDNSVMNQILLKKVITEKPDITIFVPHTDQFIPEIIDEINLYTKTIGYFFDDMWRIDYSRFWAKHFMYITTSDVHGVRKFRDVGIENVIYSPFACNTEIYHKKNVLKTYDVSFIGQWHPQREWLVGVLKKAKFNLHVWGLNWPTGMATTEEMITIFNQSRINLNLSNCISWDLRSLIPPFRPVRGARSAWSDIFRALTKPDMKVFEQVKGRHFEICACGGFQLSYYVEGLERCYEIGEEIAIFLSPEDLIEKARYYLKNEDEREEIARQGYERTLKEHSMEQRFIQMFEYS